MKTKRQQNFKTEISANEAKNGRINFTVRSGIRDYLPPIGTLLTFLYGRNFSLSFTATLIDASGKQKTKNLRINKALLKEWYATEKFKDNDSFILEVVNANTFKIYKKK